MSELIGLGIIQKLPPEIQEYILDILTEWYKDDVKIFMAYVNNEFRRTWSISCYIDIDTYDIHGEQRIEFAFLVKNIDDYDSEDEDFAPIDIGYRQLPLYNRPDEYVDMVAPIMNTVTGKYNYFIPVNY